MGTNGISSKWRKKNHWLLKACMASCMTVILVWRISFWFRVCDLWKLMTVINFPPMSWGAWKANKSYTILLAEKSMADTVISLFVSRYMDPNKMQGFDTSFWESFYVLSNQMVPSVLLSMVALITLHLKNLIGCWRFSTIRKWWDGEQNRGYLIPCERA